MFLAYHAPHGFHYFGITRFCLLVFAFSDIDESQINHAVKSVQISLPKYAAASLYKSRQKRLSQGIFTLLFVGSPQIADACERGWIVLSKHTTADLEHLGLKGLGWCKFTLKDVQLG